MFVIGVPPSPPTPVPPGPVVVDGVPPVDWLPVLVDAPPAPTVDDPVDEVERVDQIGDRGLAIAADTFSMDRIREKVRELEAALPKASNSLVFSVDEVLKRPVITVIDKKSGDVVRTLPSDEVIRVVHNIERMKGILFEGKS